MCTKPWLVIIQQYKFGELCEIWPDKIMFVLCSWPGYLTSALKIILSKMIFIVNEIIYIYATIATVLAATYWHFILACTLNFGP